MLVLLTAKQGDILQKSSCKRNLVGTHGTGCGKVVFALLEDIVTLQVSFTSINVWEPSFQKPLIWVFTVQSGGNDGSQNRCRSQRRKRSDFKDGPDKLLEVILQVPNHRRVGGARSNKRSDNKCNSGSKSICCDQNRGAMVAILGGASTSKLVFAVKRMILARIATSGGSSHEAR